MRTVRNPDGHALPIAAEKIVAGDMVIYKHDYETGQIRIYRAPGVSLLGMAMRAALPGEGVLVAARWEGLHMRWTDENTATGTMSNVLYWADEVGPNED